MCRSAARLQPGGGAEETQHNVSDEQECDCPHYESGYAKYPSPVARPPLGDRAPRDIPQREDPPHDAANGVGYRNADRSRGTCLRQLPRTLHRAGRFRHDGIILQSPGYVPLVRVLPDECPGRGETPGTSSPPLLGDAVLDRKCFANTAAGRGVSAPRWRPLCEPPVTVARAPGGRPRPPRLPP